MTQSIFEQMRPGTIWRGQKGSSDRVYLITDSRIRNDQSVIKECVAISESDGQHCLLRSDLFASILNEREFSQITELQKVNSILVATAGIFNLYCLNKLQGNEANEDDLIDEDKYREQWYKLEDFHAAFKVVERFQYEHDRQRTIEKPVFLWDIGVAYGDAIADFRRAISAEVTALLNPDGMEGVPSAEDRYAALDHDFRELTPEEQKIIDEACSNMAVSLLDSARESTMMPRII